MPLRKPEIFRCRICRGTGRFGNDVCMVQNHTQFRKACADCIAANKCPCCKGYGDHLGGVCEKDLQGKIARRR